MSGSFEKSVKGGTKTKLAPPKSKYVEHILVATHAGDAGVAEIFRALQNRLRDSTWTVVFKGLIIVHMMIREGEPDVTLRYIANNPRKLAINTYSDVQAQGLNIRHYSQYLLERARAFRDTKVDFVRLGEGRLKKLSVNKGLLRETEAVQHQIATLLACDLLTTEPENEISLTAFRLLVTDLLALFYVMNEGVINILEHFFEMSKVDSERALAIYKTFSKQTHFVVEYLAVARQFEMATRLEVPKLKHAPTSLTGSLEEYLHDPDFEINRRQYLAQNEAKRSQGGAGAARPIFSKEAPSKKFPSPKRTAAAPAKEEAKGPAPDLIDFFESIEHNQQPMAQSVQQHQAQPNVFSNQQNFNQQPNGQFSQSQSNQQPFSNQAFGTGVQQQPQYGQPFNNSAFAQQQPQPLGGYNSLGQAYGGHQHQSPPNPQTFTGNQVQGAGDIGNPTQFGQPAGQANGLQPQSTNPFRQSMMAGSNYTVAPNFSQSNSTTSPISAQSTNPFAQNANSAQAGQQGNPFGAPQRAQTMPQQPPSQPQPLQSTPTGTNPFTRGFTSSQQPQNSGVPPTQTGVASNPTGSTNPFRQSMFQNQQSQGTFGGYDVSQMPSMPVFPRPGGQ